MSPGKALERENKQTITRNKQSRRKMLKTMAAGSGAVVTGPSLPRSEGQADGGLSSAAGACSGNQGSFLCR